VLIGGLVCPVFQALNFDPNQTQRHEEIIVDANTEREATDMTKEL
jgi:hypothetical protein